jgi:hypothetical protein
MFEAAVRDGTQQFRFQQQIREVGRVDTDVMASTSQETTTERRVWYDVDRGEEA